jgi:hypothetical protein
MADTEYLLDHYEYDIVIFGTGLKESILAGALAYFFLLFFVEGDFQFRLFNLLYLLSSSFVIFEDFV